MKISSHFVGQKRNKINGVSMIVHYSNQVMENKKQLVNIYIEYFSVLVLLK